MKVIYDRRSQLDIERIRGRIAKESGSQEVADNFVSRLIEACDTLANLPGRHPPYHVKKSWRMMPFGNYVVLYQLRSDHIEVGHVRHAARKPFRGK